MADDIAVIGMLGGMSWQSTMEYYRLANEGIAAARGGLHSARVLLSSVDFGAVEPLLAAGRWDALAELFVGEARRLEAAGADVFLLCTNTMHRVADEIAGAIGIPLLNVLDVTRDAALAAGLTTVGLLGTGYT